MSFCRERWREGKETSKKNIYKMDEIGETHLGYSVLLE